MIEEGVSQEHIEENELKTNNAFLSFFLSFFLMYEGLSKSSKPQPEGIGERRQFSLFLLVLSPLTSVN